MFKFLTKLMIGRQINFEKGEVLLLKEPICLMPIETVVEIQKNAEKKNRNILYFSGKASGKSWFLKMAKRYFTEKMSYRDIAEWGNNIIALAGYGETKRKGRNCILHCLYDSGSPVSSHPGLLPRRQSGDGHLQHRRILYS